MLLGIQYLSMHGYSSVKQGGVQLCHVRMLERLVEQQQALYAVLLDRQDRVIRIYVVCFQMEQNGL